MAFGLGVMLAALPGAPPPIGVPPATVAAFADTSDPTASVSTTTTTDPFRPPDLTFETPREFVDVPAEQQLPTTIVEQPSEADVVVRNTGSAAVVIEGVQLVDGTEFEIVDDGCSGELAADSSCSVRVRFLSSAAGQFDGLMETVAGGTTETTRLTAIATSANVSTTTPPPPPTTTSPAPSTTVVTVPETTPTTTQPTPPDTVPDQTLADRCHEQSRDRADSLVVWDPETEMALGMTERVVIVLTRDVDVVPNEVLPDSDGPIGEVAQATCRVRADLIAVSGGFDIVPLFPAPGDQLLTEGEDARWSWNVTPTRLGPAQQLQATITSLLVATDGTISVDPGEPIVVDIEVVVAADDRAVTAWLDDLATELDATFSEGTDGLRVGATERLAIATQTVSAPLARSMPVEERLRVDITVESADDVLGLAVTESPIYVRLQDGVLGEWPEVRLRATARAAANDHPVDIRYDLTYERFDGQEWVPYPVPRSTTTAQIEVDIEPAARTLGSRITGAMRHPLSTFLLGIVGAMVIFWLKRWWERRDDGAASEPGEPTATRSADPGPDPSPTD